MEDPLEHHFSDEDEATDAYIAPLIFAYAKHTEDLMRSKNKSRKGTTRRKERTSASRAAARRLCGAAYPVSVLLPVITLINRHTQAFCAGQAIKSALGDSVDLIRDDDTAKHVPIIVDTFIENWTDQLTPSDNKILDLIRAGIGIVHGM